MRGSRPSGLRTLAGTTHFTRNHHSSKSHLKSPDTPATAATRIARHLQQITHQHFFKTFDDWLALAVNAFLRDDPAYMEIMQRYGPRTTPMGEKDHPADHFARALGAWMQAMQTEAADYLGRVYEEQAVANSYAGQFFTPEPLVDMMATMTMPDDLPDTAIVNDPACGSGRMLIAGIKRNRFATFVGVDTDLTCVHMTALNCRSLYTFTPTLVPCPTAPPWPARALFRSPN